MLAIIAYNNFITFLFMSKKRKIQKTDTIAKCVCTIALKWSLNQNPLMPWMSKTLTEIEILSKYKK